MGKKIIVVHSDVEFEVRTTPDCAKGAVYVLDEDCLHREMYDPTSRASVVLTGWGLSAAMPKARLVTTDA